MMFLADMSARHPLFRGKKPLLRRSVVRGLRNRSGIALRIPQCTQSVIDREESPVQDGVKPGEVSAAFGVRISIS